MRGTGRSEFNENYEEGSRIFDDPLDLSYNF